jgi:hypothetical protein
LLVLLVSAAVVVVDKTFIADKVLVLLQMPEVQT